MIAAGDAPFTSIHGFFETLKTEGRARTHQHGCRWRDRSGRRACRFYSPAWVPPELGLSPPHRLPADGTIVAELALKRCTCHLQPVEEQRNAAQKGAKAGGADSRLLAVNLLWSSSISFSTSPTDLPFPLSA